MPHVEKDTANDEVNTGDNKDGCAKVFLLHEPVGFQHQGGEFVVSEPLQRVELRKHSRHDKIFIVLSNLGCWLLSFLQPPKHAGRPTQCELVHHFPTHNC